MAPQIERIRVSAPISKRRMLTPRNSTAGQKPFAEALYKETLSHIKQTDATVPYKSTGTGIIRAPRKASSTRHYAERKAPSLRLKKSSST